ncbi:MAG: YbaK/EbsC family protein [Candidatus Aenigmarchaeota archaeon]|nr:YbaK/EbsC family protein [Candidatus Aenigmarchaeota archaeon]
MEKELKALKKFLDDSKVHYEIGEHGHIRTAEQASVVRGVPLSQGVKSLIFKIHKQDYDDMVLILVRGDKRADNEKLVILLGAKNVQLASHEEVFQKTNCEVGSVHPFGNLHGLQVYMDKTILENEKVSFSAGTHNHSISMKTADFVKLIKPKIEDIAKA